MREAQCDKKTIETITISDAVYTGRGAIQLLPDSKMMPHSISEVLQALTLLLTLRRNGFGTVALSLQKSDVLT